MNSSVHKTINKLARIFAVFLIVSIICGIVNVCFGVFGDIFDYHDKDNSSASEQMQEFADKGEFARLKLDLEAIDVKIISGEKFSYSTNNKYITASETPNGVSIIEQKHNLNKTAKTKLTITLPENAVYSEFLLDSGAGNVEIEALRANVIDLELGAGNISINDMNVASAADIDTGAGSFTINNGKINNLDMECGVGRVEINAELTGFCEIDCGVGELNLNIRGNADDYCINVDKGLGDVTINGQSVGDNTTVGNGFNRIKLSGGIGSISVSFSSAD